MGYNIMTGFTFIICRTIQTILINILSAIAFLFRQLDDQSNAPTDPSNVPIELEKWRKRYAMLCQLTDQTSKCFRLTLLLAVFHDFTECVIYTATVLKSFTNIDPLRLQYSRVGCNRITLIRTVCWLMIFVIAAHQIQIQVMSDRKF